jgi:hypothetical protein
MEGGMCSFPGLEDHRHNVTLLMLAKNLKSELMKLLLLQMSLVLLLMLELSLVDLLLKVQLLLLML